MGSPLNPTELYKSLTGKVTELVVLAIIGFGTTAVSALVKWVQDHTSSNRGAELTSRISALSKTIAELPDVPLSAASTGSTPRSALTAQLESAVHQLTALQDEMRAGRRFKGFTLASVIDRVRSTFLLYRPKGWPAWTLHLAFYAYMVCYLVAMAAILDSRSADLADDPQAIAAIRALQASQPPSANVAAGTQNPDVPGAVDTVPRLFAFITIFGMFAIPAVLLRYGAAWNDRRQCEKAKKEQERAAKLSKSTPAAAAQQAG